jgi:hypothetical protein
MYTRKICKILPRPNQHQRRKSESDPDRKQNTNFGSRCPQYRGSRIILTRDMHIWFLSF